MKLSLYYPLPVHYVTQKFGETAFLQYYKDNGVVFRGHNGLDLVAHHGDPVRASHDGIAYYQIDQKQGHGVVIITNEKYDYEDSQCFFKSIYWHLCSPNDKMSPLFSTNPNKGTPVKVGDIIGYADNTGLSDGDHLHFGLKPVAIGEPNNTWYNLENTNGYNGAIDPTPYFNRKFAHEGDNKKLITLDYNLRFGSRGSEVTKLQKILKEYGYFTYPIVTDFYGKETQKAVLAMQYELGVVKFGIESLFGHFFGQRSRKALLDLINK